MLFITAHISIPKRELQFVYGTSTGPGGQHVNRVATKATLLFDVLNSKVLSQKQQDLVLLKLATRINKAGILRVSSSKHRSQHANTVVALERFAVLLREEIKPVPKIKKS